MARKKQANLFAPILFMALVFGGCSVLFNSAFGDDPAPEPTGGVLPPLIGKTLTEAENAVEALGADMRASGIGGNSYCDDRTLCEVYRMTPKAGTVVRAGEEVAVTFLDAKERKFYARHKKMPKVVGWSEEKADRFFAPIRDVLDTDRRESKKVPSGKDLVIKQSPKAGKRLKVGQPIKLVIGWNLGDYSSSTGDGDVDVPNRNRGESRFCSRRWWC
jgi:beta-lactam-binding protein with PASTA domain